MYILDRRWQDGYLDAHRGPGEVRIQVACWRAVSPLEGVDFAPRPGLATVASYVREVGVRTVVAKVRSRLGETLRNHRFVAVGLGRVVEADDGGPAGAVAFVAPAAQRAQERIVLDAALVRPIGAAQLAAEEAAGAIRWLDGGPPVPGTAALQGWFRASGHPLDAGATAHALAATEADWRGGGGTEPTPLALPGPTPIRERHRGRGGDDGLSTCLFGLGNYAKSVILPNLHPGLDVRTVHEIDPAQIGRVRGARRTLDTAGRLRDDERHEVYLLAGYHHTHAELAVASMDQGAAAVVEKPLVTDRAQLARLLASLEAHPGRLFACFHMRYNPLYRQARRDLGVGSGDPIHYSCDVFEVPLPALHWYRWPRSGSHLVSNGCHWLDHFLFLNEFAPPTRTDVRRAASGDTQVLVELANGASFGMHLTHIGSPRIGVQDHVVLRAGQRTVTVDNGSRYVAEDAARIVRRTRRSKMAAYRGMYRTISERLLAGEAGDSTDSVRRSCELMLDVEQRYHDLPPPSGAGAGGSAR